MLDTKDLISFPLIFLLFYSILFYYILFFFILFYFYDQGMLVTMVNSTPVLFLSRGQSSTHSVEDQNKLEAYGLNSATLSIKRPLLYLLWADFLWPGNTCYQWPRLLFSFYPEVNPRVTKQAWGLWPQFCYSFYQEIEPPTYFRWIVDEQNMLETSDLHSCPPSVQRPVISAPFYNSSRMSLNIYFSFGSIHIVLSDILRC